MSSSGHCYLLFNFLKKIESNCADFFYHTGIYSDSFLASFDHVLHLATLAVLAVFFFDRWKVYFLKMRSCLPIFFKVVGLTALADIVTAFFYILFKMYSVQIPLVVGFGITMISLLSLYFMQTCAPLVTFSACTENTRDERKGSFFSRKYRCNKNKICFVISCIFFKIKNQFCSLVSSKQHASSSPARPECFCVSKNVTRDSVRWESATFTPAKAIILGLVQGVALLPGISRLATTYAAARWLGMQPRKAFEISWLIAVPLFLAASVQGVYKILHMPEVHDLVLGSLPYILCASILAYLALQITAYLFYARRGWWFGVYMLLPICLALNFFVV